MTTALPPLLGHGAAVSAFAAARASGRLHHAWLLAGPEGVGKGGFARAAALRLLAEGAGPHPGLPGLAVPADHPTARLWAAGSHPDVRLLERLWRDKTKDLARNVTVDQVRDLARLFATAPSLSPWRVVIVDAADDLEASGANALLKLLEEPPANSVFLLVAHAPQRLLPTIRSRCRVLRFAALGGDDMARAVRGALPDAADEEVAALVAAGGGVPGRAVRLAGLEVRALDRALDTLVESGDRDNAARSALARQFAGKAAQPRFQLLLDRLPSRIAEEARRRTGQPLAEALAVWEQARAIADRAVRLSLDQPATVFELAGLLASLGPVAQTPAR